jgi:N-acetylneuraminic acid mutarotase
MLEATGSPLDGRLFTPPAFSTLVTRSNGSVLVVCGTDSGGSALSSAELYNPSANTWSGAGTLVVPQAGAVGALLPTGNVLIAGGQDTAGAAISSVAQSHRTLPAVDTSVLVSFTGHT